MKIFLKGDFGKSAASLGSLLSVISLMQCVVFAPLLVSQIWAAGGESRVEVVESIPLETTLAVPGIRPTQQVWLEMIQSAKSSIDIEQFYIFSKTGEALEPVLLSIRDAASRGVQIRIIVDSQFYKNYSRDPIALSQVPGIQVKVINFSPGIQHSKYFVVDQIQAYVGSANFDWLALTHIHEIGLNIRDAQIAAGLESVFAKDWAAAKDLQSQAGEQVRSFQASLSPTDLGIAGGTELSASSLQMLASPPSRMPSGANAIQESLPSMIRQIDSARKSVNIQVYQYSTKARGSTQWTDLDAAMRNAAKRGVQVQLLVDSVALRNGNACLRSLAQVKNIQVRSVLIPEWSGGHLDYARLIHSKYFTVDGKAAWVGSENWSENYFTSSRNVGVIVQSPEVASQLDQIFNQVWSSGYTKAL